MFVFTSEPQNHFVTFEKSADVVRFGADPAHLAPMDLNIELEWRWY